MAERVCYRLAARSPFHIGERGVGIEETSVILHSDTLFSALCLTLRELDEDLDAFLARFPRVRVEQDVPPLSLPGECPPPLRLSSAFPYAGDTYFFPRPLLRPPGLDEIGDPKLGKTLKKIRFVSQPIFEALLAEQPVSDYLVEDDPGAPGQKRLCKGVLLQGGRAWVTPQEVEPLREFEDRRTGEIRLWAEETVPRVTVDRVTNRSQVYAAGRVRFAPRCGLFFLVEYGDSALRPRLEMALRALGDAGVGGERSSGHGQFKLEVAEAFSLAEPPPDQANAYVTLSLYWPMEPEVLGGVLEGASYGLVNRRGWIGSPDGMNLRRQGVRMLAEGSMLCQRPEGALADVKPLDPAPVSNVPHDVWRYGLAFPLRCRIPDEKEVGDGR
jgi:CRISPR-associated protein Csm4